MLNYHFAQFSQLPQNKFLLSLVLLGLINHKTLSFNDPKEGFGKHCGKRRNCLLRAISPFPTVFSDLSKREIVVIIRVEII